MKADTSLDKLSRSTEANTSDRQSRVIAIVQARMGSARLPGKVLSPLGGRPMLEQILTRTRRARLVTEVIVATTSLPADDEIAALASKLQVAVYRGSELDVLDRYYQAAQEFDAQIVVRLTADNPLVEGEFIDWCVAEFINSSPPLDYLDTTTSQSFPYGLSVEVFSRAALRTAWQEATDQVQREHVTLFIRQHPDRFRIQNLGTAEDNSDLRWTVDTPADMMAVRRLYDELGIAERIVPYQELLNHIRKSSNK